MIPVLLAAEGREASPIGLVVVLCLVVAVVLLIRSMNRHLRRVPPTFTQTPPAEPTDTGDPTPGPDPRR